MAKSQREAADKSSNESPSALINEEDIARRAYSLYLARGGEDGSDVEDWLEAEALLRNESVNTKPAAD
jgi:hypothetical protein